MKTVKLLVMLCLLLCAIEIQAESKLRVVGTLSTFADLVKEIGGDRVDVSFIAPPKFDPHFIEPRPSDILKMKRADLYVYGGLDLEMWSYGLLDATGRADMRAGGARQLDLSQGINVLERPQGISRAQGDLHANGNPHYFVDPRTGLIMAENIAKKLSELDPEGKSYYEERLNRFRGELTAQINKWQSIFVKYRGHEILAYHNTWVYLADFLKIKSEKFIEFKPGIAPTPTHLQDLKKYLKNGSVKVLVFAGYNSKASEEFLTANNKIKVVELCQNVAERDECSSYLRMNEYNLQTLAGAFQDE